MNKCEMLELLHKSVVPAVGCTEPACVAIAAADSARAAGGTIERIQLDVSSSIYKNGMSVGIAGFENIGLEYAAALGACIGKPEMGLEIMNGINEDISACAIAICNENKVEITIREEEEGIFVRCVTTTGKGEGLSLIRGSHTNIVLTEANGIILFQKEEKLSAEVTSSLDKLKELRISEIRELVLSADENELNFLADGIKMNQQLADFSIKHNPGIGIAEVLILNSRGSLIGDSVLEKIMIQVAAATEARLDGCPYAAMSSAGSGSKGIAVILPVVQVAEAVNADRKKLLQAMAFAHLLNEYINGYIGKLSAVCTCAVASATAAAAAIAWLMGGDDEQIGYAIRNMSGNITGMICDGGKVGCALKLSTASGAAFTSALLAVNGVGLRVTDGICAETPEACIKNIARIGNPGMIQTDKEILHIMLSKGAANSRVDRK